MIFPAGRIALVGNSGSEIGNERGAEIDSHDHVFRFNNFKITNEKDYGSKTTGWITSFWYDVLPRDLKQFQHVYCPLPLNTPEWFHEYQAQYGHGHNLPLANQLADNVKFLPFDYYRYVKQLIIHPSTGMLFTYWLFAERIINYVNFYGFGFFDKNIDHHYFEQVESNGHHNGVLEMILTKGLQCL